MGMRTWVQEWPVYRQLTGTDPLGRGAAAASAATRELRPRTATADRVVKSVCPYCAVGCAQNVYVKDGRVVQIEGDPDSPVSRGRLCPKGSATLQLTTGDARRHEVLYRRPYGTDWEPLDLETAMDMVTDRVIGTRRDTWQWEQDGLRRSDRTLGIASLGGATLDNEENYLIKKLCTGLGVVQVENQARVCHSSTVAGLGTSFGRGGATTFLQDLQNADCIVIEGSNFAEAHPVGFQWVMEAKARGAKVIHVDPRFTRTSALADLHVPIRAGTDIAFLGGIINHVSPRSGLPRVRAGVHQRGKHRRRGLPGHRGPGGNLLRSRRGDRPLRHRQLALRGRPGPVPQGDPDQLHRGRPGASPTRAVPRPTARAAPRLGRHPHRPHP